MSRPLRGIFPVVLTPFADDGSIDTAALAREVDFSVAAGTHGLVFPVLASEFQYLSDAERHAAVETVVRQAGGRVPVVAGVAAPTARAAAEHAAHAAGLRGGCGDRAAAVPGAAEPGRGGGLLPRDRGGRRPAGVRPAHPRRHGRRVHRAAAGRDPARGVRQGGKRSERAPDQRAHRAVPGPYARGCSAARTAAGCSRSCGAGPAASCRPRR